MKTPASLKIFGTLLFVTAAHGVFAQTAPQHAAAKTKSETPAAFAFEPLDHWKAAVLAGDRSALMGFYTTEPAARAKTPQGETLDPAEEPSFWSSLKPQGLDRLNVQVLETKTIQ